MMNKLVSLLLVFSLAFNIAFVGIWAYERAARRHPAAAPPGPWAELGLTPPQRQRLQEGWRKLLRDMAGPREQSEESRERLLALLAAEPPDREAITAEHKRMEEFERQVRSLVVAQMLETRDVLTPAQRQQWLRLMRARGERAGWRRRRENGRLGAWRRPLTRAAQPALEARPEAPTPEGSPQ